MNITNEAYFSPSDLPQKKIIEYLHKAQQQLCICVFTISDNMITEAIVQCARKGIPVQIVTDNDKTFDKGSDIWVLAKEGGIEIKVDMTDNHMHHKFALIDDLYLITGSYNWTRSAAYYNHENIFITNDTQSIQLFQKEFEKLWENLTDYEAFMQNKH